MKNSRLVIKYLVASNSGTLRKVGKEGEMKGAERERERREGQKKGYNRREVEGKVGPAHIMSILPYSLSQP